MNHAQKGTSRRSWLAVLGAVLILFSSASFVFALPVVDTGQVKCYNNTGEIACPPSGYPFFGQDAQYAGVAPAYKDNGDGTVTDMNTGLMWQKSPGKKMAWKDAAAGASAFNLAGYTDWRLPTIKELYSLIKFTGRTGLTQESSVPFLDTRYFDFSYGNTAAGERFIDAQYCSSTQYVSTTMNGSATIFGVNFADGRIKGYPRDTVGGGGKVATYYVRYVRGKAGYGVNDFADNGNGTITNKATGQMWMQYDSGALHGGEKGDGKLNWQQALAWCENLTYAGYSDWRLPDAKELEGLVDYTRSPKTTNSAAISPLFATTSIKDGNGATNYPYFWTGTTHLDGAALAEKAVYIAFGEAQGYMKNPSTGAYVLMDVHGAGAQRSDPKAGNPANFPNGFGPQGDVISIYNYARCVRATAYPMSRMVEDHAEDVQRGADEDGASYYYQPFENGTALAAWTDGKVYYYDGATWQDTGSEWK